MLTPSGVTLFVLEKLRIRRSGSKLTSYLDAAAGEVEGYKTRLLWTIPEEEEEEEDTSNSHKGSGEHVGKLRNSKKPAIKASPGLGVVGGDCNCSLLVKCMQLKSTFTAPSRSRRSAKVSNSSKAEGNDVEASSRSRMSSIAVAPARHRSKADEDQLRQQCNEIYDLYRAIAGGRLSLEQILNLRL